VRTRAKVRAIGLVAIAGAGVVGLIVASGPASAAPVVTQFTSPGVVAGFYTVPAGACFVTLVADGGHGGNQFGYGRIQPTTGN
jgi:hypothetical protein